MTMLSKKIDFVMFYTVRNANPNGDPLGGNIPRTDNDGYGEVSDVCIKRKIRNRMQDMGHELFVQANERIADGHYSLQERFNAAYDEKAKIPDDVVYTDSCKKWIDVRSFGQVMTYQKRSIGIRGPVSINISRSLHPVETISMQITRSTNGMTAAVGKQRSSDTMGSKHFVPFGVYSVKGSINVYFSEKTGFSEEDAEVIKEALRTLFVNDASSARPEGSMEVKTMYWFTHPSKLGVASSAKVFDLIQVQTKDDVLSPTRYDDYVIGLNEEAFKVYEEKGLLVEIIEGM